jgi:hypothetical protein
MTSYDTIIIGAGLSGLWLAHRLRAAGEKVALVEARETLGGRYRRQNAAQPFGPPSLELYPAEPAVLDLLQWVQGLAPTPLQIETHEHRPRIFDEGKWRNFAGFGETKFESVDQLTVFGSTSEVAVTPGLEQLVRALVEQLPLEAMTMHEVTAIKVAADGAIEVTSNGDKTIRAPRLIYTAAPIRLNDLISGEALAAKHRTRLAKATTWTAVTLELEHPSPLIEENAVQILSHNSKDFEPIVGRGFGPITRWMTLVNEERGMDHEFIGQTIRHIKRQIKRPWPAAFDGPVNEKIFVLGQAFGQVALKTKSQTRFPELPNIFLANHALGTIGGALGSLEMARAVETELLGPEAGRGTTVIVQP